MLPSIVVHGVRHKLFRLDGEKGNLRFLLRSEGGELFGVYARNAQGALSAAPLKLTLSIDNPFRGVDLFESDGGGLVVWCGRPSRRRRSRNCQKSPA
jgi:hypothetical protein